MIILLLFVFLIIGLCVITKTKKESLSWDDCSTKCNEWGSIFDCCECLASGKYITNNAGFNTRKRECLCKAGYQNYCYTPVTNLLLSQ